MVDQSQNMSMLEPSAWLGCHMLQYLFTSSPRPLFFRHLTADQRMLLASFRTLPFNTFLLVLKGLFLISNKETPNNPRSGSKSNLSKATEKSQSSQSDDNELELEQFASNVLQEICDYDWIKERCFSEGDNLLRTNQLLESAIGRKAQNLFHIIAYPRSHYLRKQNEQSSTKDFIY